MRRLILLLLLAHVAVAFWAFGPAHMQSALWDTLGPSQPEPERWALQRRPEAIVVVAPAAPAPAPPAAPLVAPSSAPATDPATAPAAGPAAPPTAAADGASTQAAGVAPAAAAPSVQGVQRQGRDQETNQPPKP